MLFEDKFEKRIPETIGNKLLEEAKDKIGVIEQQISDIKEEKQNHKLSTSDLEKSKDIIKMALSKEVLDRQILEIMIDKIIVYHPINKGMRPYKDVKIIWTAPFGIHCVDPNDNPSGGKNSKNISKASTNLSANKGSSPSEVRDYGFDSHLER